MNSKKILKIVKTIIINPKQIIKIINTDKEYKQDIAKKYGLTHGLPVIDILDLIPALDETISSYSFLSRTSQPIDIVLIKSLAKNYKKGRYLEIGTWRGESIANLASICKECVSISLSDSEMRKRHIDNKTIKLQRFFSKNIKNIKHIGHDSQSFDYSKLGKFDLIFIDGDHSYKCVKKDTENVFKVLKDDNSIIIWHDYGKSSERINWPVLAGILDGCEKKEIKNLYHISNTLCALYIKKKFRTYTLNPPAIPNKYFTVTIKAHSIKDTNRK